MRRLFAPVAALAAALALITAVLAVSSADPASAIASFFTRPFSSWWYFGNMLNLAGLLIVAATGASLALKGGAFNLGGEAQIYAGALVAAVALSAQGAAGSRSPVATALAFGLALLASAASGALLGFIPGILKARLRVSEILASFLLSAAVIPLLDYLIAGPLRDDSGNLLATKPIGEAFALPSLAPPSFLNASFFAALALACLAALFLGKTATGYRLVVSGTAPEFAALSGFPVASVTAASMATSGLFHGLAGFFAITGTWRVCHQGLTAGMGWSALAVALIARANPLAVIPAALLYAWLDSASDMAFLSANSGFDSTSIVQAIILIVVSARFLPRARARKVARQKGARRR